MNPFQTHPSVRIKGTENNYEPVACVDPNCPKRVPHMHCPFCVQTESYQDPVILKAHYRVKHVDKGIEFAGLKILRCCDHCDIVGSIKGTKEFKGAHWHCYKCRNGFNRRDEAIKHYRTHFRNPQTTFQIQIAQEVNQPFNASRAETEAAAETITSSQFTLHPSLAEAAMMTVTASQETGLVATPPLSAPSNGKEGSDEHHVAVAANETVGTSEGQTIMIIQADESLSNISVSETDTSLPSIDVETPAVPNDWLQTKIRLEKKVKDLTDQNAKLEAAHAKEIQAMKAEIENLKFQLQVQNEEVTNLQKKEEDLVAQLSIPLSDKLTQTLNLIKAEHENLLHQQLALLKRTYATEVQTVAEITETADTQNTTASNILVISDSQGAQLQGRFVTTEDGRQIFVDSSTEAEAHEMLKGEAGGHYEIAISKPLDPAGGDTVLSTVADTPLIMAGGADFTTTDSDATIQITYNTTKRKDIEDSLQESVEKKTKF